MFSPIMMYFLCFIVVFKELVLFNFVDNAYFGMVDPRWVEVLLSNFGFCSAKSYSLTIGFHWVNFWVWNFVTVWYSAYV